MIRDENTYPVDTVVLIRETGEFAIIKKVCFLMDSQNFQHYLAEIEGKKGQYAIYHDDVELGRVAKKK